MKPNRTRWVDRHLNKFLPALKQVAPDSSWMPDEEAPGVFKEHGCGHYGCVMPTNHDDTVFKLTTDPSEAAFVRAALSLSDGDDWPDGMIRYKSIYQLAGATHFGRPIFAVWRQEAEAIGFLLGTYGGYQHIEANEARAYIDNAILGANALRKWLVKGKPFADVDTQRRSELAHGVVGENYERLERSAGLWGGPPGVAEMLANYRGADRAAIGLRVYDACIELMEMNNPIVSTVGRAMGFYREHAIVLADVHYNNIGNATAPDYDETIAVITDPGHAVFLDKRFDKLTIEELRT